MLGHRVLQRTFAFVLATACLCTAGVAASQAVSAQPASASGATRPAASADDMAMPEDMGAPIADGAPAAVAPSAVRGQTQTLSVDTPIAVIAASPQGKAALEHELPGLCERPEYVMFRTMSPAKLALLSNGRISRAKLIQLQAHLTKVNVVTTAEPPRQNLLAEGGVRVKRFSRSVYRKVLSAIESL